MVRFSAACRRRWPDVFLSYCMLLARLWVDRGGTRPSRPAVCRLGNTRRRCVPAIPNDECNYSQGCRDGRYFSRGFRRTVLVPDSKPEYSVGGRGHFVCLAVLWHTGPDQCGL